VYGGVEIEQIERVKAGGNAYDGCFVGRIHPQKGVVGLIEIWHHVCKVKPDARLALIGNGPKEYENKVRIEIIRRGLEDSVDLLGYVDGVQKYAILKSSKVFLHTSVYDNSGMTGAEAMACGVPVVRFDIPTLEVAYPKGTLVAPLLDYRKFADLVLILLSNHSLYSKMSEQGKEIAKEWDWDKRSNDSLEFVQHLLDRLE
jgi:glycosyltransferase involved in cell wall biosynthesis